MENNSLGIIITASYIQSHPYITIIKQTIESLQLINKKDIEIIITHDYHSDKKYLKYLIKLNEYVETLPYKKIRIIVSDKHVHLTGIIRNAIEILNTKYVLIVQHDLPFIENINIDTIMSDMNENPKIKHVRFNKRKNIKIIFDGINDLFGEEINCKNHTYTRTPGWSDNNHLSLKTYYSELILKECLDGKPMEEQIHGKSFDEETHLKWGTYLFGKNNDGPYINHIDGKNYGNIKKTLPYMNNDEIVDLITYINRDTEMLEIGGGNSAIFLSKIVKKLVTIEHDENWSKTIKSEMEKSNFNSNWELHVVKPSWKQSHPFSPAEEGQFLTYTNFILSLPNEQFDVILVDGRDRVKCAENSILKLKKNGILLIHDFWNREKYHSILNLEELELIKDTNSYIIPSSNTLAAFKKK